MTRIIHNFNYTVDGVPSSMGDTIARLLELDEKPPIILCIGSDKFTVDCLGPIVGDMLNKNYKLPTFIYGGLRRTVTARNLEIAKEFISLMHPNRKLLVVDACVGQTNEFGLIKVVNDGIFPGIAVGKNLEKIGDISILGVVAERTFNYKKLLYSTKLNTVIEIAEVISKSIFEAFSKAGFIEENLQFYKSSEFIC